MVPAEKMISKDSKANDNPGFQRYLSHHRHFGNHYSLYELLFTFYYSLCIMPI